MTDPTTAVEHTTALAQLLTALVALAATRPR